MERITSHRFVPAIERAFQLIPEGLHARLNCDILVGCDPKFVGLHRFEDATYGRSFKEVPHCAYPHHQDGSIPKSRQVPTMVLPLEETPETVVHEFGHILHYNLNQCEPVAKPVSWYAETNWLEAFAEAFTSWVIPGYADDRDPAIDHLLERLSAPLP